MLYVFKYKCHKYVYSFTFLYSTYFNIDLISFQLFTWVKETLNASYAMKPSDTLKIYIYTPKKYTKGSNSSAINVVKNYSIIEG